MNVGRRTALKVLTSGSAAAAAARSAAAASETRQAAPDAAGMLYDATLCIGCKACEVACSRANGLSPDTGASGGLYQAPQSLNSQTKNIIKVYQERGTPIRSFMKQQCMHCIDPACVSGCPMGALSKGALGIVGWEGSLCIGCRYCQIACPYNIPKFEWSKLNPKIVKCELCRHLIAQGGIPACVEVCPRHAVIYGKRADLMAEAKRRIAQNPGRYFENRVYGEHEGGGTQVLYLSHVPFGNLGLPLLGATSLAARVRKVEDTVYQGFLTPIAAYGALVAVIKKRWDDQERAARDQQAQTGLEEQL
jgi:Fe-S-cluster-containing dehydrogenase component